MFAGVKLHYANVHIQQLRGGRWCISDS